MDTERVIEDQAETGDRPADQFATINESGEVQAPASPAEETNTGTDAEDDEDEDAGADNATLDAASENQTSLG